VAAFYKDKLGSAATVRTILGSTNVHYKISQQEFVEVKINAFSNLDNGKTRILITHTKISKAP
jgi:hypothetical protein